MKRRWIALLLIFTLAFVFVGCKKDGDDNKNDPRSVEISIDGTKISEITLEVGEEKTVVAKVKPDAASQDIVWESKNPAIATVDNGKITAVAEGETDIIAKAKAKDSVQAKLKVIVVGPPADPESVEIVYTKTTVPKGGTLDLSAIVLPEDARQEVEWESDNPLIATVNDRGTVTGIDIGTVTITVKVKANPALADSIEIEVHEAHAGDPEVKIQGEGEVQVGSTITLMAMIVPDYYSQRVTWESLNPSIATVDDKGVVTGLKEGQVWIVATSVEDPNIQGMHPVVVKPKPAPIPYPDLQGYEIIIMAAPHALHEHDPFSDEYGSDDKVAKQQAWQEVQSLMNCELKVIGYPDSAPWGQARIDWLNNTATTNQAECDIFVSTTEWLIQLVEGGAAHDVLGYYQKYGQNAMSPGLKGASTYKGGLYSLIYPPVEGLTVDKGLFYNVNLIEQLQLTSPAKKFNDGEWSFSDFKEYVLEANSRLGEDMSVLSGRPVLYYMGMVNSSGVPLANIVTNSVNFSHTIAVDTVNLIKDLYDEVGWGDIAWDASVVSFNEQRSIFQSGDYWFINTDNRWPKNHWGEGTTRFGYVPYPYHDSKSKDDAMTTGMGGACYMQANGRQYPAHVNSEYVYRAFTEMMLKTAEKIKADVTYDPEQKMRNAAMKRLSDPESVDAIIFFTSDRVLFDPMYELGGGTVRFTLATAIEDVVVRGEDYAETIAEIEPDIRKALADVYGSS